MLATNRIISVPRLYTVCMLHIDCTLMSLLPPSWSQQLMVTSGVFSVVHLLRGLGFKSVHKISRKAEVSQKFLGNGEGGSKNPTHPCSKIGLRPKNLQRALDKAVLRRGTGPPCYMGFSSSGTRVTAPAMCIISLKSFLH